MIRQLIRSVSTIAAAFGGAEVTVEQLFDRRVPSHGAGEPLVAGLVRMARKRHAAPFARVFGLGRVATLGVLIGKRREIATAAGAIDPDLR
jgi:hypothetical protein